MGYPSIFPTGTLIYDKDKTFNAPPIFQPHKEHYSSTCTAVKVSAGQDLADFRTKSFRADM